MQKFYVTSALLTAKDSQVLATFDWNYKKTQIIDNKSWLTILEIFIHEQSLEAAYQCFQKVQFLPISERVLRECTQTGSDSDSWLVVPAYKTLKVLKRGFLSLLNLDEHSDFSSLSQNTYQVIRCLFNQEVFPADEQEISSFEAFSELVEHLATLDLLSPFVGTLDWGDLRRKFPLCPLGGFTRGTPIDRYYLNQFISEIRDQIAGTVLEVGGVLQNRELYQFTNATEYQTIDVAARPGVTLVGDIHDKGAIKPESLDAVVIFNVLEHCHNPWVVVQNIYSWLKVGGQCFCMVPSAQRLHYTPADYWRPLPDGMKQLFQYFSQQKLYVYGNALTVLASFMGISAEELLPQDLDDFHPDYPVATCIVAIK